MAQPDSNVNDLKATVGGASGVARLSDQICSLEHS